MTERELTIVHGHSIDELESLLKESCGLFDNDVHLQREGFGGMSNINIRGHSNDQEFVLKLPGTHYIQDAAHYRRLHDTSEYYAWRNIAAMPLCRGLLSDRMETPFIIFEYIDGVVQNSLHDFSDRDKILLKECLNNLYSTKPPSLRVFNSPSSFLEESQVFIDSHVGLSSCSQEVFQLNTSFSEILPKVLSYSDSLGTWTPSVMHGDLWGPNIVIQSKRAVLLDFEACAIGNRFYDFAYILETEINPSIGLLPNPLDSDETNIVSSYRVVASTYMIIWSIERLLSMEAGLVEPNLNTKESWSNFIRWTRPKISRLKEIL